MRLVLFAIAALLVLALGGCGGQEPAGGREPEATPGSELGPFGVDVLNRGQIERFARLSLPPSTTNLHSEHRDLGPDEAVLVSFDMDAGGLEDFKASFGQPLQPGANPFAGGDKADPALGWEPDSAQRPLGLNEVVDQGLARLVLIDRADPAKPRVYMSVSTL